MQFGILFSFTSLISGLALATVILFVYRHRSIKFLVASLCTFIYYGLILFLYEGHYLINLPFLLNTWPVIISLMAPTIFFYIVFAIDKSRRLRTADALHLLPAILFVVDFFPTYISDNETKKTIIEASYSDSMYTFLTEGGWLLPSGIHYLVIYGLAIVYVVFLFHHLKKFSKPAQSVNWTKVLINVFFVFSCAGMAGDLFSSSSLFSAVAVWQPLAVFAILGPAMALKPEILHVPDSKKFADNKAKQFIPDDNVIGLVQVGLQQFINDNHFLNEKTNLTHVAETIGVQPYVLSAYINHVHKMRFNDLINGNRIEYVKNELNKGEWNSLTLEAIGKKAGFSNRTTFLNAFKKSTGVTPNEFLQKCRQVA